jgi:hypothetical protein
MPNVGDDLHPGVCHKSVGLGVAGDVNRDENLACSEPERHGV